MKFRYKVLFTNLILLSLGLGLVGAVIAVGKVGLGDAELRTVPGSENESASFYASICSDLKTR